MSVVTTVYMECRVSFACVINVLPILYERGFI